MFGTADALTVAMPQVPRLTRPDEPADKRAVDELRTKASRPSRASDRPRSDHWLELTPTTPMPRSRVQRARLRSIPDPLATGRAEPLMRRMRHELATTRMARTDAERLPTVDQMCTPIPTLTAQPPIPVHRAEKPAATLARPISVHSDLTGRKIHGGGSKTIAA
jgi:hypothetical protein